MIEKKCDKCKKIIGEANTIDFDRKYHLCNNCLLLFKDWLNDVSNNEKGKFANIEIRNIMNTNKITQHELADKIGITQQSFSRLICKQLTPENEKRFLSAINEILERREK